MGDVEMTEAEFELRQSFTHYAGRAAGLEEFHAWLIAESARMFATGLDREARLLRDVIAKKAKELSARERECQHAAEVDPAPTGSEERGRRDG